MRFNSLAMSRSAKLIVVNTVVASDVDAMVGAGNDAVPLQDNESDSTE